MTSPVSVIVNSMNELFGFMKDDFGFIRMIKKKDLNAAAYGPECAPILMTAFLQEPDLCYKLLRRLKAMQVKEAERMDDVYEALATYNKVVELASFFPVYGVEKRLLPKTFKGRDVVEGHDVHYQQGGIVFVDSLDGRILESCGSNKVIAEII